MIYGINYVPLIDESMTWNACGTKAVKRGFMSINSVVVGKRFVPCTQEENCIGFMIILRER